MAEGTPQDPQEAIEAATGKYQDQVDKIPPESRALNLPKAPDPKPFRVTGSVGGSSE